MTGTEEPHSPVRRTVKCPQCGQAAVWAPENRWRPFCSERCRQIDLGAWASDQYRVAGSEPAGEADGDGHA